MLEILHSEYRRNPDSFATYLFGQLDPYHLCGVALQFNALNCGCHVPPVGLQPVSIAPDWWEAAVSHHCVSH
eukprot:5306375-Amphidinium_carterae.3